MRWFFLAGAGTLVGVFTWGLPNAELFLVEGVELPESDVVLKRRVLIGIRD